MCVTKQILIVVFLTIFDQTRCLIELPNVEDNDIVKTEAATRNTINSLFSLLRLTEIRNKPRLKQFAIVHNYFASLTLQDYNSLNAIAKLTRTDKANMENKTTDLIALLNEILAEENMQKLQAIINGEIIGGAYDMDTEVHKLEHMKNSYADTEKILDINGKILEILNEEEAKLENVTSVAAKIPSEDQDTLLHEIDFWQKDDELMMSGRRIFKSHRTKIKRYPFIVSVQIFNKFQCAGSIIKSDLVVTAASCLQLAWNNRFYRENPQFLSVRVGSSFYESGGDHIAVLEVYFHPGYNPRNLHDNIAVMRLTRRIKWKSRAKKIALDTEAHPLPMSTDGITVLGWGARTSSNLMHGAWLDKLGVAVIDVYPLRDCQEVYSKEYVTQKNFCAGFISVGGGACNRDVGGPGIAAGILAGIISFGAPVCGTPDAPTVFTKVGYYYDWIEEIMELDAPYIKQRTTRAPLTFPYQKPTYTKRESWTMVPLSTDHAHVHAHMPLHDPASTTQHGSRNLDKKLFKEFLKTMFDSDEIRDYLDTMTATSIPKWMTTEDAEQITQSELDAGKNKRPTDREPLEAEIPELLAKMKEGYSARDLPSVTIVSQPINRQQPTTGGVTVMENVEPIMQAYNDDDSDGGDSDDLLKRSQPTLPSINPVTPTDNIVQTEEDEKKQQDILADKAIEMLGHLVAEVKPTQLTSSNLTTNLNPKLDIDDAILTLLYITDNETEISNTDNSPSKVTEDQSEPDEDESEDEKEKDVGRAGIENKEEATMASDTSENSNSSEEGLPIPIFEEEKPTYITFASPRPRVRDYTTISTNEAKPATVGVESINQATIQPIKEKVIPINRVNVRNPATIATSKPKTTTSIKTIRTIGKRTRNDVSDEGVKYNEKESVKESSLTSQPFFRRGQGNKNIISTLFDVYKDLISFQDNANSEANDTSSDI